MDPSLEERRLEWEMRSRSRELDLKERKASRVSPTLLGLLAATVGLLGNVVVAYYNNRASMDLERFKSQSSLVLEAIKTGDPDAACRNLEFLADLNRIDNPGQIKEQCKKIHPYLPAGNNETVGSCVISSPAGTKECIVADQKACGNLAGAWRGGSCGP